MTLLVLMLAALLQGPPAVLLCSVTTDGSPVESAEISAAGHTVRTDAKGAARLEVPAGTIQVVVVKQGFVPATVTVQAAAGQTQTVSVPLEHIPNAEETVTVSATRSDKRLEDQPMRVEVLGAEEIEEKLLMTPGDIVMMLNEMGGMRVQATSASLGAASIRVQGMRGRYTRFLSDGLPLFGDVGGLGLLQIPPSDLGQVEVIKGVASALYGAGALGGVVNLISRRAGTTPVYEALVNRTSLGGTDAVFFAARPLAPHWSLTSLVSGHWQEKTDVDQDGWADLAGYSRAVVRPRLVWDNKGGRSFFATMGVTWERRNGGTMAGRVLPATGLPFQESLETARYDAGLVAQTLIGGRYVMTGRFSTTAKRQDHGFGGLAEQHRQRTIFAELAIRGSAAGHSWVAGAAFEQQSLTPRERPDLGRVYRVPGAFVQDDVEIQRWLTVSASARVDAHNVFGTFASPRVSALLRGGPWNSRVSFGLGFFAPSPFSDDTEAAGLSRLTVPTPLRAERGRSVSWDVTRTAGPVTVTGTLFHYRVQDPSLVDRATYSLVSLDSPTVTSGAEMVATYRKAPISVTATYTYVRSREGAGADRGDIPLTPRHSAGLTMMWEREATGRVGVECYLTGRQRLEDNPYAATGRPYVLFGGMIERRFGGLRLFLNAENLAGVRQTRWNPLLRPSQAVDGRWTVDAWAPLDGRVINGGVRVMF